MLKRGCYPPATPPLRAGLLLAATVDPRPTEPPRLLAEVGAREAIDDRLGQFYSDLPESLNLTLAVGDLPHGSVGRYDPNSRTVTLARSVIGPLWVCETRATKKKGPIWTPG